MKITRSKKWILVVPGLATLSIVVAGLIWWSSHPLEQKNNINQPQIVVPEPKIISISSKVLFTGNSFWGRYTNDNAMKTTEPYKFPFARLSEFDRQKYDSWITGLECPTTKKGVAMTSAEMEATLTFNCDPAYLGEFAKWFDIVTLANNHTDNMGADGFLETQQSLGDNKIQYFGHYDPSELDEVCEVVSLPVKIHYDDKSEREGLLPVAMCGYHGVFKLPSAEAVALISKYAEKMPVIVFPHAGAEYKPVPDQIKTSLYRSFVDAGADMVVGDHPHWVQSTEVYNGKLIIYSMGNFMFDQQFNQEVTRSAAIDVEITSEGGSEQLEGWLELGDGCKKYHDDCFDRAEQKDLSRIQLNYKFNAIATSNKGYQAYPAPELQNSVEQRLGWQESMKALGQ